MATAPTPIDFTQYQWALGDTARMVTQWNAMQAALTQYGQDLVPFGDQMTAEMQATEQARDEAVAARDEAQQIAVGDVAITALQPGTGSPGEIVTPDGQGGLVYSTQLKRYDLASVATTATLDLAASNVFRVDASSPVTLAFANAPGADRAMTVAIHIAGNSAVTWPTELGSASVWDADEVPTLGDNETKVVAIWDGLEWSAFVRVAK